MRFSLLRVLMAMVVGCMPASMFDGALASVGAAWHCAARDAGPGAAVAAAVARLAPSACCGEGCTCDPDECACRVEAPIDRPSDRPATTPPPSGSEWWRLPVAAPSSEFGAIDAGGSHPSAVTGSARVDRSACSARAILLQSGVLRN